MLFYIVSIVGGDIIIALVNCLVRPYDKSILYYIIASVLGAIGVIAIDGIAATFIRRALPEKWFDYHNKRYRASKKECKFYEKIGIKWWKDKVIELGMFTSFSKKTVANPDSREYVERFILECNYGSEIHLWDVILGFALIFCYPHPFQNLGITLPVTIINAFLNILPFMILRYNNDRLSRLRDLLEKKEARAAKTE